MKVTNLAANSGSQVNPGVVLDKALFAEGVLRHLLTYLRELDLPATEIGAPPGLEVPGKVTRGEVSDGRLQLSQLLTISESHTLESKIVQKCPTPSTGVSSCASSDCGDTAHTTMMMRNIPNKYDRHGLLALFDSHGFKCTYDFVYHPIDYEKLTGLGYAFVNFISTEEAERFKLHFDGFKKWSVPSRKCCEVTWSTTLQGLHAHVERFRDSDVMHESVPDEFKPALFELGERVPFPVPTKKVRAPKLRRAYTSKKA